MALSVLGRCMDMESEHKELQLRNVWSQSEREVFREKYLQHPKNFGQIASFLPRKSVRDCVRFYYLSKKAENYKQLLRKPRQRRSARNPPRPAPEPDLPAGVTTRLQRSQGATARSVDNKEPSLDETGLASGVSCILPTAAPQPARTELRTPPLIPSPPPASSAPGGAPSVADSPPTPPPLELTPDTPLPPLPPMPPPTTCEAMMTTTVVTTSSSPTSVPSPLPATSLAPATVAPAASSPAPVSLSAAAVSSIPTPPPGSAPPTPQPPPTPTQPPPTPETAVTERVSTPSSIPPCSTPGPVTSTPSLVTTATATPTAAVTVTAVTTVASAPSGACAVCGAPNATRTVSRARAAHYGLQEEAAGARVCEPCHCRCVRSRYTRCPVPTCPGPRVRAKRLRHLPPRWHDLSPALKRPLLEELQIPSELSKCCLACFKRITRRLESAGESAEPSEEEVSRFRALLREHGTAWERAGAAAGRSPAALKAFYFTYRIVDQMR
ncbi:flocculation protein FLO11-like [Ostrinia furnacalis]|uniref:flocculation protein FLO11-like n=1 Tax=Ostrinia furnacalis TaxID=93504 RepID=UPI00103F721A|nr:flocculation protein FLO11-like [Ostrinia furnacalis]